MAAINQAPQKVVALPDQQAAAAKMGRRRLLSIASGKGGVGKTWLSITLAHALARGGRQVLLFDGDLGLANVDVQLGINPELDLTGTLAGAGALREAALPVAETGFDVIAGRSGCGSLAGLAGRGLDCLGQDLARLALDYDRVIIDLGAGIDDAVRQLAAQSATCLVVATDEPTSLTDAYAFLKLSWRENPEADLRLVINMATTRAEGQRTYDTLKKACESFLCRTPPLAGIIRHDRAIKEAIRHQSALLTRSPTCPAAEDVERLARAFTGDP